MTSGSTACDPALKPLFGEIGDLKRIRSAERDGTIASRLFRSGWSDLLAGIPVRQVALRITADALAATRLGDIDASVLALGGVDPAGIDRIRRDAIDSVSAGLPYELVQALHDASEPPQSAGRGDLPAFVSCLERQPRAGATCPGKPRIVLEPPENHAEHCAVVAVLGVLLSPGYGADLSTVFLAGLAHHLHNADLPDSGFTGEMLLGSWLEPVVQRFAERALSELPDPLRQQVTAARSILPDAATPEGRAFHAADAIDRVMQLAQHLKIAALTMDQLMDDMALVHAGPVKAFQDRVLAEMALP